MEISKKMALLAAACVLVAGGCFYFASRGDVSDIGKRADDTRARLESAREEQREQAGSLDRAESAIRNSAERADRVEEAEHRDAEIIRECKSIIARVRERSEKEDRD